MTSRRRVHRGRHAVGACLPTRRQWSWLTALFVRSPGKVVRSALLRDDRRWSAGRPVLTVMLVGLDGSDLVSVDAGKPVGDLLSTSANQVSHSRDVGLCRTELHGGDAEPGDDASSAGRSVHRFRRRPRRVRHRISRNPWQRISSSSSRSRAGSVTVFDVNRCSGAAASIRSTSASSANAISTLADAPA